MSNRPGLSDGVAALSCVAAYCYAVGWVFYNFVFGQLHIEPEDVGIGFDYLVTRAALVLGGSITLVSVVFVLLGATKVLERARAGQLKRFESIFIVNKSQN